MLINLMELTVPSSVVKEASKIFFLSACQCNGHSKCINQSICEKCENLTTGKHCETCISGFYGDPTNGGKCQRKSCPLGLLSAGQVDHRTSPT